MTVIISAGKPKAVGVKGFPLPTSTASIGWTSGVGSVPLLRADGRVATYEGMYRTQPWVFAVVNKIVQGLARLPLKTYSGLESDERERERTSDLDRMLRRPWTRASAWDFKWHIAYGLCIYDNALFVKSRPSAGAPPNELWRVPWSVVSLVQDERGIIGYDLLLASGRVTLAPQDVLHYTLNGGVSPLEPLRRTLALEDGAMMWQEQSLANGVTPRGAFTTEQRIKDSDFPRLREELAALYAGPENAGRFGLFDQGLRWDAMGHSAVDADLINQRKLSREEVCAAYDVPPPLVGILDHATYSNIEQLHTALYVDTLGPKLVCIENTTQAQLIDPEPAWDGYFVEFDTNELLRPDPATRMQSYLNGQQSSTLTINERRKFENLPPIDDPIADTVFIPLNMAPVGVQQEGTSDLASKINAVGVLVRSGYDPQQALALVGLDPITYLDVQPITVRDNSLTQAQVDKAQQDVAAAGMATEVEDTSQDDAEDTAEESNNS